MCLDPRSVANCIINFAGEYRKPITQLSLQKIIYFIHGKYLIENNAPLVSGYFEAWRYGPVHPLIYSSFSQHGSNNITELASSKDLATGLKQEVSEPSDPEVRLFIRESASRFLRMTPGRLVDLSHATGSPWDAVSKAADGSRKYGMRITDELIRDLFRRHKVSVGEAPRIGEPNDESPPS